MTDQFKRWFWRELKKRNMTARQFSKESGIAAGTISNWINGRYSPTPANVEILAKYFGVDRRVVYELLGRTEPVSEEQLTEEERRWLRLYRSLARYEREQLTAMVLAFARGSIGESDR